MNGCSRRARRRNPSFAIGRGTPATVVHVASKNKFGKQLFPEGGNFFSLVAPNHDYCFDFSIDMVKLEDKRILYGGPKLSFSNLAKNSGLSRLRCHYPCVVLRVKPSSAQKGSLQIPRHQRNLRHLLYCAESGSFFVNYKLVSPFNERDTYTVWAFGQHAFVQHIVCYSPDETASVDTSFSTVPDVHISLAAIFHYRPKGVDSSAFVSCT